MLVRKGPGAGCTTRQPTNGEHDPLPRTKRGKDRKRPRPPEGLRYQHTKRPRYSA